MAAAAAGIFNHRIATAAQALASQAATPVDSSTPGTSGTSSASDSSSGSATISANDFLTLLVTEMQNQDPTSDTDPNEYINQLVQVNSLEQLIDINQTLNTDLGSTPASSGSGATGYAAGAPTGSTAANPAAVTGATPASLHNRSLLSALQTVSASPAASAAQASAKQNAPGNLSVPGVNRSAQRVGRALNGHAHAAGGE
jgi:flagellar basal-body rod modification protein FlgD